jgi:GT2 family glycosyltransferase
MAKITALVSAYYAEDYISRRIENLLECTPLPEIIVVCRSGSAEHKIAQRYPVTTVATQDVPTIGKAWNIGIKLSHGEYLTTANTDDYWLPGGMERLAKVLDSNPRIDLAFSKVQRSEDGVTRDWNRCQIFTGEIDFPYELIKQKCLIGPMPMWRRSVHDQLGLFDEQMVVSTDYDMWLRMAHAGKSFYYISRACGVYEYRDDSLEHRSKRTWIYENSIVRSRYASRA